MRKLAPEALYNPQTAAYHQHRQALHNSRLGIHTYPGDWTDHEGAWDRAAANMRKKDPEGIMARIVMKIVIYGESSKTGKLLGTLFENYRAIPVEERSNKGINESFHSKLQAILSEGERLKKG